MHEYGMRDSAIITGASGFIGSHLACKLLRMGRSVVGIDNFDVFYDRAAKRRNIERIQRAAQPPAAFQFIEADILERDRMCDIFARHRPGSLFHIAALAGVRPSIANPARYASVNINGLINVLDAARDSGTGCRDVVFASSSSVYGNNAKVPFAETDAVDEPISPYAATKRAGELICHSYAHLFGMRIAALRFFTVFGPAQRPDLAIMKFMRLIAAGEEVPMYGDGSTSRDYTYIDDIVHGILAAETAARGFATQPSRTSPAAPASPPAGFFRIYNLGGAHPHTLAEMIDTIARVVGKPAQLKRQPMQPGDVERTWADLTRSRAELGFEPKIAFEDGVRLQWDWLRATMHEPLASAIVE